jgi:hypothetical protein
MSTTSVDIDRSGSERTATANEGSTLTLEVRAVADPRSVRLFVEVKQPIPETACLASDKEGLSYVADSLRAMVHWGDDDEHFLSEEWAGDEADMTPGPPRRGWTLAKEFNIYNLETDDQSAVQARDERRRLGRTLFVEVQEPVPDVVSLVGNRKGLSDVLEAARLVAEPQGARQVHFLAGQIGGLDPKPEPLKGFRFATEFSIRLLP